MKIEEGWVGTPLWFGPDGIPYSDIDLEPDARLSAPGHEREPRTNVFVLGPNRFNFDGRRIEGQAVRLELGLADRLDIRTDRFVRALSSPEKIKVSRRAIGLVRPRSKEHCAFENEAITNARPTEAVQESLGDEGQEQELIDLARGARAAEQSGLDGRRQIGRRLSIHGMESMYGCMTR
jgi:hypothetical protein